MGKRRRVPPGTKCVFCGEKLVKANATDEHLIPKNLFPKERRYNLIKIWLCRDCNGKKAQDDDHFRDTLITELATDPDCVPDEVMQAFLEAASRNQSDVARAVLNHGRLERAYAEDGTFRGVGVAYNNDPTRLSRYADWIARGLYFYACKERLPTGYKVRAGLISPDLFLEHVAVFRQQGIEPRVMGHGLGRLYYQVIK